MSQRPNVVVFLCDQMRPFEIGCYGGSVRTPHLDRLTAEGTRFETAISPNPVCTPARSCILTGQYSRTCTGMLGNVHDDPPNPKRERLRDTTLPEAFRDNGYRTGLIGKWHIDPQPQLVGFDRSVYPYFIHRYFSQTYLDEALHEWRVDDFGPDYELDQARTFLTESAGEDRPFFLYYNIGLPHQPIGPGFVPETLASLYKPGEIPVRPNVPESLRSGEKSHWFHVYYSADFWWKTMLYNQEPAPEDLAPEGFDYEALLALYASAIATVDDYVGRFRQLLAEQGLAENTILLFTSDHGDNLGSHGRFNKSAVIEEAIRIPYLVYDPRQPGGRTIHQGMVSLIDTMPTLLDLAGLDVPGTVQGRSAAPAVRGETDAAPADHAYVETHNRVAIRTRDHLLAMGYDEATRTLDEESATEFWNLETDPYEMTNRAGTDPADKAEADLRDRLQEDVLRWNHETPWLTVDAETADQGLAS